MAADLWSKIAAVYGMPDPYNRSLYGCYYIYGWFILHLQLVLHLRLILPSYISPTHLLRRRTTVRKVGSKILFAAVYKLSIYKTSYIRHSDFVSSGVLNSGNTFEKN